MKFADKRYYVFILLGILSLVIYVQLSIEKDAGSIYSAKPFGAKAFFLFLKQRNIPVKPWLHPLNTLDEKEQRGILFVVSPQKNVNFSQLKSWISAGNDAVYLGSVPESLALLTDEIEKGDEKNDGEAPPAPTSTDKQETTVAQWLRDLYNESLHSEEGVAVNCEDDYPEICGGVQRLSRRAGNETFYVSGSTVIIEDKDGPILMRKKIGEGILWIFTEETVIKNEFIDKHDNLRLLYQLATNGGTVYFDEFHHGYVAPAAKHIQSNKNNIYLLAGFIMGFLILLAITRSFRFGPPTPATVESSPSTVEFTSALGLLYSEHNATSVLHHYFEQWKKRIGTQFSMSSRLSDEVFIEKLSGRSSKALAHKDSLQQTTKQFSKESRVSEVVLSEAIQTLEKQFKS